MAHIEGDAAIGAGRLAGWPMTVVMVVRSDDNGNMILVADNLTAVQADALIATFNKAHKQTFQSLAYDVAHRAQFISDRHILE